MNQLLLEKYIRKAVYKALREQEEQIRNQEKSLYLIHRFPGMKKIMIDLMSPAYDRFVANVQLIAPKPTTFNITLINGMDFIMTYSGNKNFIAKIQGKKYNMMNLGETERASQSIANILELNYNPAEQNVSPEELQGAKDNELAQDIAGAGGGPGAFPGENEPSPEETNPVPGEEAPLEEPNPEEEPNQNNI